MSRFGSRGPRRNKRHVLLAEVHQRTQNKKLQGHLTMVGIGVVVLGVIALGTHFATRSILHHAFFRNDDFQIKNIEIKVTGGVSRSEVIEWAGVRMGSNLMILKLPDVRERLQRMPYIASVVIERRLPSTLRIEVVERQPMAKLLPYSSAGHQLAQSVYYVDGQGYVMRPKAGERLKPLPVIKGVAHEYIREGERTERAELLGALNLLRLADYTTLKSELDLTEIEVQSRGYLILRTRDQGMICFRTDYLQEQIQRLRVILDHARENNLFVRTVDLTPERNVPVTYF
ncbi:MAG: FtsQ-type POTRA domain-containing protein [Candidatus Methylacidiphilales bacterium]|nr:FtsQ-type POTRA domain-containing protein [Candidatus Methylacidiphilales bacterium]